MNKSKPIAYETARSMLAVRLLRIWEVELLTGTKKSWIWACVAEGSFPKPIKLSSRITVWRGQDVLDWMDARGER
jgi:prophage regulatory protein